jgi:hypothetical protein
MKSKKKDSRILLKWFKPAQLFWFVGCNLCLFRDLRCVECTLGLLGFGFLAQFYYGKQWL